MLALVVMPARTPARYTGAPCLSLLDTADLRPPSEKVVAAVQGIYQHQPKGTQLTAADLAAEIGMPIEDARVGMKELATALAGADGLSVSASSKGDLLYTFPADVRKQLSDRDNIAKARDAWNSAKPVLQTVGRVSFGIALFASIAIIYTAITVLQSSSDERKDGGFGGERGGGGMIGGGGGGDIGYFETRILLDLLFPPFPFGYYGYGWFSPPPKMSLPEAIFSFVFGDGNPNAALRAARVRAMSGVIRANGGAVVAESLAPYLDPPASPTPNSYNVDESWLLPAISELGGRPEVTDDGTIVYVFDDLTVSAVASDANLVLADPALASIGSLGTPKLAELATQRNIPTSGSDAGALRDALKQWAEQQLGGGPLSSSSVDLFPEGFLVERPTPFSNAEGGQLLAAGALGLVNFGGAAYLGSLLADISAQIPPGAQLPAELGALQSVFPFLLAYAVAYVAIPAVRYVQLQASNAQVEKRNANRRAWRDALRLGGKTIRTRLAAAGRRRKTLRIVGESDVEYDSSKGLDEQKVEQQPSLDDFDRRLRESTGGS